jgi:hypothetical protein
LPEVAFDVDVEDLNNVPSAAKLELPASTVILAGCPPVPCVIESGTRGNVKLVVENPAL